MPAKIVLPDPDSMIANRSGMRLYARDIVEEYPLYRGLKIIADKPFFRNRRTAYLYWIVHLGRFRRGGDAWLLSVEAPDVLEWAAPHCAERFDLAYVKDYFGFDDAELADLVAAEIAKYGDEKPAAALADLL